MEIEIYSDVICPWCYIGTRRLQEALRSYDGEVTLRWRAYQLDPNAPRKGQPLLAWLGARFGGEARARQMSASAVAAGASAGITMDYESALVANTFDAHRLIRFAGSPEAVPFGADADTQQHVVEALHAAHFTHGRDIADLDTLVDAAGSVGLDRARVERLLRSDEGVAELNAELSEARDARHHQRADLRLRRQVRRDGRPGPGDPRLGPRRGGQPREPPSRAAHPGRRRRPRPRRTDGHIHPRRPGRPAHPDPAHRRSGRLHRRLLQVTRHRLSLPRILRHRRFDDPDPSRPLRLAALTPPPLTLAALTPRGR